MSDLAGFYKATIVADGTQRTLLLVLNSGQFQGFDGEYSRFHGTYVEDEDTLEVILTAEASFLVSAGPGQPAVREVRPFAARIATPPAEIGKVFATPLKVGDLRGTVIIERLGSI